MRKQFAPQSCVPFLLSLLVVAVLLPLRVAKALPEAVTNNPFGKNAGETFKAAAPDPGVVSNALIEREDARTTGSGNDAVIPESSNLDIKIPPIAGFEQIANMKPMKETLKRMITADVPVMFQTMMMVENGAATGYIGSLNTVGSLLSNTIQASSHQIELLRARDPSGGQAKTYTDSAYISLTQKNKGSWPAALWYATGDPINEAPKEVDSYEKNLPTGSNVKEQTETKIEGTGTGAGTTEAVKQEVLLSNILFPPGRRPPSAEAGWAESDLKIAFTHWVGDVKTTQESTGDYASKTTLEAEEAVKFREREKSSNPDDEPANVYEYMEQETIKDVWKHFHEVLKNYCEFKQSKGNYSKQLFQKKKPSQAIMDKKESWEKIHSLDIKPSINLIDQLFKLFMGRRNMEEIKCDTFKGDESTLPEFGAAPSSSVSTFDSCETEPKRCLRNVVLYRITKFIAQSQVNYYYRWMWEALYPRLSHPANQEELEILFCKNLGLGYPCDPGTEFSTRIDLNRVAWIEFSNRLSKFAQGQGGATIFKPAGDASTLGSAGAVSMGNGGEGK